MRKIITVSREFGSGGRELAKRLADSLDLKYIDSEIIEALARETNLATAYINGKLENGIRNYPLTFARSFTQIPSINNSALLIAKQHNIIKEIASKEDCIIVGRGADAVLAHLRPYKIFVYADMRSKIARCKERMSNDENLSEKEIEREIKRIDKSRKSTHDLYSPYDWGDKVGYNLCVNTTDVVIKDVVSAIASLIKSYFKENDV